MRRWLMIAASIVTSACAADHVASSAPARLQGTSWQLIEIRSNDDAIGTASVARPNEYSMTLGADGSAMLRLGCNRGTGRWSATPEGGFSLGPLATTRALCPPPAFDQQLERDADSIRSYLIEGDRLYLNLMADGGTYVWRRSGVDR